MNKISLFFTPIVYDQEVKSFKERLTELVDEFFYYGGRRIHVIDDLSVICIDPLSTLGKCLIVAKIICTLTLIIPALLLVCKLALNPRDMQVLVKEQQMLAKYQLCRESIAACKKKLEDVQKMSEEERMQDCAPGPMMQWFIRNENLLRLDNQRWLNDECINIFFEITQSKAETAWLRASSFSFLKAPELHKHPYSMFRQNDGTIPTSLFDQKRPIFVPINLANSHWLLLKIDLEAKKFGYYNSLLGLTDGQIRVIKEALAFFARLENQDSDPREWEVVHEACPQQPNGYDCGVFVCMALDRLSQGQALDYSARDVPYMRLRMLAEIINQTK